jgi:hypothetical protein
VGANQLPARYILGWTTQAMARSIANSAALWFNLAMFNLFKRDPVREKLKMPVKFFTVTLAGL